MPSITGIRDAACAYLKENLPEAIRVETFAGYLDFDRLAPRNVQFAEQAAIFLAPGQCVNVGTELVFDCEGEFWVFSVSRHASRPTIASNTALNLIQKAALTIHGQTFGLQGVSAAVVKQIGALGGEDFEKAGIWVWMLNFSMRLAFGDVQ